MKIIDINKNYGGKVIEDLKRRLSFFKIIFLILNIFIWFSALVTSIFAILVTAYYGTSLPSWYPFLTAGIGAFTTFTTSLINFFLVRDKIKDYQNFLNKIRLEVNKYNYKLMKKYQDSERNWHLFLVIESIIGNNAAAREVINE